MPKLAFLLSDYIKNKWLIKALIHISPGQKDMAISNRGMSNI